MSAVPLPSDDDETPTWPITPEIIGTVLSGTRPEQEGTLKNEHIRFLRKHANRLLNGRITLVIQDGKIVAIEATKTYNFSPEK